MSKPASTSAALPIAYVVLRLLIVVNWLFGAAILTLLLVAMPTSQWIRSALGIPPSPEADPAGHRACTRSRWSASPRFRSTTPSSSDCSRWLKRFAPATRSSPPTPPACRRSPGRCWRFSCSASSSARSPEAIVDAGASARRRCRLLDQRLARRAADVPAGPRVHGRHAHARRPRRDGVTWRSPSSSTTCSTTAG